MHVLKHLRNHYKTNENAVNYYAVSNTSHVISTVVMLQND